jgi:hypothetical protein
VIGAVAVVLVVLAGALFAVQSDDDAPNRAEDGGAALGGASDPTALATLVRARAEIPLAEQELVDDSAGSAGEPAPPLSEHTVYFECDASGCIANLGTPIDYPLVVAGNGDNFAGEVTQSPDSCPIHWTGDITVTAWETVAGIRVPAEVTGTVSKTLGPAPCSYLGWNTVYEGESNVIAGDRVLDPGANIATTTPDTTPRSPAA